MSNTNLNLLSTSLYLTNKEAKKLRDENSQLWDQKEKAKEILFECGYETDCGAYESLRDMYSICPFANVELTEEQYNDSKRELQDLLNIISEVEFADLDSLRIEAEEQEQELSDYLSDQDYFMSIDIEEFLKSGKILAQDEAGEYYTEAEINEYLEKLEENCEIMNEKKQKYYDIISENNEKIQDNKELIQELYELKEKVLDKALELQVAEILGFHKFKIGNLALVKISDFTFHHKCDVNGLQDLGEIKNQISSEIKGDFILDFNKAFEFLTNFVG